MTTKKTILILDDEVDLREMLKFQFTKKGYNVVTAPDGMAGLEILATTKPDLIILDMNMPRMGGIEFYHKICDTENQPKYPIFVLTARANLEKLFKDLDVKGFLSKPFDVHHLVEEVDKILATVQRDQDPAKKILSKQILIVDSDDNNLKEISWVFLKEGFRVNTAHNGSEAIEQMNRDVPDYALINWELSDISGDALALKMQKTSRFRTVKIIIYTGKSTDNMAIMDEIRKRTAMHQLVESQRPNELLAAVKESIISPD